MKTRHPARPGVGPESPDSSRTRRPGSPRRQNDPRPTESRPAHAAKPDAGRNATRPAQKSRSRGDNPVNRPPLPRDHEWIYGRNGVSEALRGPRELYSLIIADGVRIDARITLIEERARERGVTIERAPRELLDDLVSGNHQGILLEAGPYLYQDLDDLLTGPGTVLVLDHLQDPQNLGTLLRAAEASGVCGVVIPEHRAAAITPAVVNASAGAVELLQIARVSGIPNAIKALRSRGWWIAVLDTGDDALDAQTADFPLPVALVVGAEGHGISALVRKSADFVLSLPMPGQIESLNAATAGSIALYEILRRERIAASGISPQTAVQAASRLTVSET